MNINRQITARQTDRQKLAVTAVGYCKLFKRHKEHSLLLVKFSSLLYSITNFPATFNATKGRVTEKPLICCQRDGWEVRKPYKLFHKKRFYDFQGTLKGG
jgi:hypothetical protein